MLRGIHGPNDRTRPLDFATDYAHDPAIMPSLSVLRLPAAALIAMLAACGDPVSPFQPEVASRPDGFQLQATGVRTTTTTTRYTWDNAAAAATVNHSTTTTGGEALLTIRDAAGTVVYNKRLAPSLNEPTASGTAGRWTIEFRLTEYAGSLNVRVEKR